MNADSAGNLTGQPRRVMSSLIGVLIGALAGAPGVAAEGDFDAAKVREKLEQIESRYVQFGRDEKELGQGIKDLTAPRSAANQCVTALEPQLARIDSSLKSISTPDAAPPTRVPAELARLNAEKKEIERNLADCRLLLVRADDLIAKLTAEQNRLLRERLLHQGPNIQEAAVATLTQPAQLWEAARSVAIEGSGIKSLGGERIWIVGLAGLAGLALGFLLKPRLRRLVRRYEGDSLPCRTIRAVGGAFAKHLPALGLFSALSACVVAFFYGVTPKPSVQHLVVSVLVYFAGLSLVRGVLWPYKPERQLTSLPDPLARAITRRSMVLLVLFIIGRMVFVIFGSDAIPGSVLDLANSIFHAFLAINLGWLVWLLGEIPALETTGRRLRLFFIFLLAAILVAGWFGYRNLAQFVMGGLVMTTLLLLGFWGIDSLLGHVFETLDEGRYEWQKRVRKRLACEEGQPVPGLLWLRFISAVLLWVGLGLMILLIWGLSDAGFAILVQYLVDGFDIGETRIVPSQVLTGLFLFAVLLAASRWFRSALEERWLLRTRLDPGARETLVAMSSYTGFAIAVLVGLSLAGFKLQNLAIIAGALSVGIGFGLQNVVNNFVSGIILLFERPVSPGDWVVVGNTEGYVKKVRVRSTEIQTFDRSDVIVPNSEFISAQVTNWTLRDPYGRVIVKVPVAYGADTDKVRDVLLEVAKSHPQVIQFGVVPPPVVLFMGFGANSLDFELRCFIRDINWKLSVTSDLNFAVDKAFRENGIEIPLPQRVLHVSSLPVPLTPGTESVERPHIITESRPTGERTPIG